MIDDEEITQEAQGDIEVANIMMDCSGGGCMMMALEGGIFLTELQEAELRKKLTAPQGRCLIEFFW